MPKILFPTHANVAEVGSGNIVPSLDFTRIGSVGRFRSPTDPVGVFTLQFRGIIEGSRVRVETAEEGLTLDEFVSTASEIENRVLSLYASGNPRNNLRIKVRNASGTPAYVPFESQAVAQLGTVTVFVFQEPDE